MKSNNIYQNTRRADSYSKLEFPNTYYLAYRDLPEIISKHVKGCRAIDFGCGTGRSTRVLRNMGFEVVGIDNSIEMLNKAKEIDQVGHYKLVSDGNYDHLGIGEYDLIFSVFTFDNISSTSTRAKILNGLSRLISPNGKIILLDSTPEIYYNEWASFSTKDFPNNRNVKSGGKVKIIMKDVSDNRPVEDYIWFHNDYLELFSNAKLHLIKQYKPLGRPDEKYPWINEMEIAPWVIYVLSKKTHGLMLD